MKDKEVGIFDNARIVTRIIIGLIVAIIVFSQSWAINNNLSTIYMFRSILNHNSFYFLLLIYFIGIKTSVGKIYFNHLNIFIIILYIINTISSFLTLLQAFSLNSLLLLFINLVLFLYVFHTMLRGTRIWKDYKLKNSPFNEISNDDFYNVLYITATILFVVNLISSTSLNGCALALLDYLYILLFTRYIYLYRVFLDKKAINNNNSGNFDEIKKTIEDTTDDIKDKIVDTTNDVKEKVNDFIEDNKIDEKIDNVKNKVVDTVSDTKEKVNDFSEENKIDEKIDNVKNKVVDTVNDTKEKVNDFVEDNKIDEKIDNVKNKVADTVNDTKEKVVDVIKKDDDKEVDNNIEMEVKPPKKKRNRKKKKKSEKKGSE